VRGIARSKESPKLAAGIEHPIAPRVRRFVGHVVLDRMLVNSRTETPMNGFPFDAPRDLLRGEAVALRVLAMEQRRGYPNLVRDFDLSNVCRRHEILPFI
jgi:hypothetical protein